MDPLKMSILNNLGRLAEPMLGTTKEAGSSNKRGGSSIWRLELSLRPIRIYPTNMEAQQPTCYRKAGPLPMNGGNYKSSNTTVSG